MKIKNAMFIAVGMFFLQACSTTKTETMWISGIKSECDAGSGKKKCLNVHKGENLSDEKWEYFYNSIEGFEFEEGLMKKVEVDVKQREEQNTPSDASTIEYALIKVLESKTDPRFALNNEWVLATINKSKINKMILLPTLKIDVKTMQVSGNGGCNVYSSKINELTTETIDLEDGAVSAMNCFNKNMEAEYHKALAQIKTYEVKDDQLTFFDEDGKEKLTFIKVDPKQPNPALGGKWMNIKIKEDSIQKFNDTPELTIDLDNMMIAGKDGCNNFNASINTVTSEVLKFDAIASTKMMCPEMELSNQFLNALRTTVTYKIKGDKLILFDHNQEQVLVFKK